MRCVACRLEIENGATKCVHCGSYQSWRGSIALSSTILSLLVALVSVTTVLIPTLMSQFARNAGDIFVQKLTDGPFTIYAPGLTSASDGNSFITGLLFPYRPSLAVANNGDRVALLIDACLSAQVEINSITEDVENCYVMTGENALIQAGEAYIFQPTTQFSLPRPPFPSEMQVRKDGREIIPEFGPFSLNGVLRLRIQNRIGVTEYVALPVEISNTYFIGYATPSRIDLR